MDLIERARGGSRAALESLVASHRDTVFSICYHILGNVSDAEDMMQETFMRFFDTLPTFDARQPVRPWLRRIASNASVDSLRRASARPRGPSLDDGTEHGRMKKRGSAPAGAHDSRIDLQRAIDELNPNHRAVITLRYVEDLSYREIAEALGISISAVESRLFRARERLAEIIVEPRAAEGSAERSPA